ncbi:MAG: NAD(P)H-binding protein [Pseudomonadota bacterium]
MRKPLIVVLVLLLVSCAAPPRQPVPLPDDSQVDKKGITIAMLGATGMAGGFIVREALAQGYDVRALARSPHKLDGLKDRVTVIQGNALDPDALSTLLEGSDVVVSALGPVRADGGAASMISTNVSELMVGLMPDYGIERYIVVSGAAVDIPGDDRSVTGWLVQKLAAIRFPQTLKDKQAEYELLAESSVGWTLVRCPIIDPEPFQQPPVASLGTIDAFSLRAGELAYFVLEQIESHEFVREGPFLESR